MGTHTRTSHITTDMRVLPLQIKHLPACLFHLHMSYNAHIPLWTMHLTISNPTLIGQHTHTHTSEQWNIIISKWGQFLFKHISKYFSGVNFYRLTWPETILEYLYSKAKLYSTGKLFREITYLLTYDWALLGVYIEQGSQKWSR